MNKISTLLIFIFIFGWSLVTHAANPLPDEPEIRRDVSAPYQGADSYEIFLL